jgi:hypothetical protein
VVEIADTSHVVYDLDHFLGVVGVVPDRVAVLYMLDFSHSQEGFRSMLFVVTFITKELPSIKDKVHF